MSPSLAMLPCPCLQSLRGQVGDGLMSPRARVNICSLHLLGRSAGGGRHAQTVGTINSVVTSMTAASAGSFLLPQPCSRSPGGKEGLLGQAVTSGQHLEPGFR